MTKQYLTGRENLVCLFILLDSRHEPQTLDKEFISYCGESGLPIALVFTKADKQSPNKSQSVKASWKRTMLKNWEEMPPTFITSAEKGQGREELLSFIDECNEAWKAQA
jgi:GTP-binding protein